MRRHALAVLLVASAPAMAQDRPPLTPTRDVAVTYRMLGPSTQGMPGGMRVAWHAASGMMRTDMPGMGWMVADIRGGRAFMVMEAAKAVMDLPLGQAMQQGLNSPSATFRRDGSASVAGLACDIWVVRDGGSEGRSCITAEGVVLRAEGTHQGQSGGMEATEVAFGPQDPARFQRPQGYQAMPGMPGAGRPPQR